MNSNNKIVPRKYFYESLREKKKEKFVEPNAQN